MLLVYISQDVEATCPSTEEWIRKIWYICIMEYYSAIKKNEIMLFAAMMNLEIIILSEVSQTKMTNIMISLIFRISFFLST